MNKKILLWFVIVILLAGAAGAYWWTSRPQVIVLNDGTRLTLLAVTYGKHHKAPETKINGRKMRKQTLDTPEESLCLWIDQKHKRNNWPNYQMMVFDVDNTGCAGQGQMSYGNSPNDTEQVVGIAFDAFPRRGRKVVFRAMSWGPGGQKVSTNAFVVSNPARGQHFETWTPSALPLTQEDGDLSVTLKSLEIAPNLFNYGSSRKLKDAMHIGVIADFHVEQNGQPATNWEPVDIQTYDATGNHTRTWSQGREEDGDDTIMRYQWGLWPNEPAWKIRVEMSRQSGYLPDEVWTVNDVPLKPGDMNDMWNQDRRGKPFAEKTVGDTKLSIYPGVLLSDDQKNMYGGQMDAIVLIGTKPDFNADSFYGNSKGMRMNLANVTNDKGKKLESQSWGWGGGEYHYAIKKLAGSKTISITVALHRSRFFEFTAKPSNK